MKGLTPGPEMLTKRLDVTYTIVWSLTLAHVIGALICLSCSRYLAKISTVRPEILLPIVLALVFVAGFEGSHDWGDLYVLIGFGMVGWIMKRLGWPRPPMVLGIVIGGIFERYLNLSMQLYGIGWLWHPSTTLHFGEMSIPIPVVTIILCFVAWALFKPLSEIVVSVVHEVRAVQRHHLRFGASAAFTVAIIVFILAAIALSTEWPPAAKPVPLTACYMALTAAFLNLLSEVFGKEQTAATRGNVDGGVAVRHVDIGVDPATARVQSTVYFAWLLAFLAAIWLVGFLPAIAIFVFAYMRFGFGEPTSHSLGFAAATVLLCWGLFDRILAVAWPGSLLGDLFPALRSAVGFI